MKIFGLLIFTLCFSWQVQAQVMPMIDPWTAPTLGLNLPNQSVVDLNLRIQHLERMVWQLQQQLFYSPVYNPALEIINRLEWICTIETSSETFTGIGVSQAMAEVNAIDNCKKEKRGSKILCRRPQCRK